MQIRVDHMFYGTCAVGVLLGALWGADSYHQRKVHRAELLRAYFAVQTLENYSGTSGEAIADLTARSRIDQLRSENLASDEANALVAVEEYIAAVEQLDSSHSIETANLREPIARNAKSKADAAMKPFLRGAN